jgi:superfamily I DNA/RNA helicase
MDYQTFVDTNKSLLAAPAGYGKTFTIAECLKHTTGKQLILTHTHAGIAAIKEKIKKTPEIKSNQYSIETISSFAQKYVKAFYVGDEFPAQELSKNYHKFVIDQAVHIFRTSPVQNILEASYKGLFVDEYQDCNIDQHSMIAAISNVLPTHILGDYLQGIFNFEDGAVLVDFDNDLNGFEEFPILETPHRWYQKGSNRPLGDHLKTIRELLEGSQDIVLEAKDDIGFHVLEVNAVDIRDSQSLYRKSLNKLINNPNNDPSLNSLLIIVPEYKEMGVDGKLIPRGSISSRANLKKQIDYSNRLTLLEAIDDRSFYSIAKAADVLIGSVVRARKPIKKCKKLLVKIFNRTDINSWFNDEGLINKTNENDKKKSEAFKSHLTSFIEGPSIGLLTNIIKSSKSDLKCKCKREEVLYSFMKALEQSILCNTCVSESMIDQRNRIRRSGRKIKGKCFGTTLLTKGLEFDTVAILDAHNFNCPKHLYVAITRACKKLVIFTENTTLSPYADLGE